MSINKEILEQIDSSDFDEDIKVFLKQGLDLEERRMIAKAELDKTTNFFHKYDSIISRIVR